MLEIIFLTSRRLHWISSYINLFCLFACSRGLTSWWLYLRSLFSDTFPVFQSLSVNFQSSIGHAMHRHHLSSSSELLSFFSPHANKVIFDFQHCWCASQTLKLLLWLWGRTVNCLVDCRNLRVRSCNRGYRRQMRYVQVFRWFIPTFLGRFKEEISCMSYLTGIHSCDTDKTKYFRSQFYSDSDQKKEGERVNRDSLWKP